MGAVADPVAFDNMRGYVVGGSGDWFGYDPGLGSSYVVGEQFVPTKTGYISELTLAMYFAGTSGPISLGIYSDSNNRIGSLLETLVVYASGNFDFFNLGPYASGSYESGATLNAGQAYWVVTPNVSPLAYWESMFVPGPIPLLGLETNDYAEYLNNVPGSVGSLTGGTEEYFAPGTGYPALGLEMHVKHVPEPDSFLLVGAALLGVAAFTHAHARERRARLTNYWRRLGICTIASSKFLP
jgi:hypothetical protein